MPRRRVVRALLAVCFIVAVVVALLVVARGSGLLYDEGNVSKRLRVAAVTMQAGADPAANRQRMVENVGAVVREHPDVDLILFGETVLGW